MALLASCGPAEQRFQLEIFEQGFQLIQLRREFGRQPIVFVGQFQHHVQIGDRFDQLPQRFDDGRDGLQLGRPWLAQPRAYPKSLARSFALRFAMTRFCGRRSQRESRSWVTL